MKKNLVVFFKNKIYRFEIRFHESTKVADQEIEPEFYLKYSLEHNVYNGTHFEMEVILKELEGLNHFEKIHIHISSKNGKKYICWTGQLMAESQAVLVAKMWCAGSVYTIIYGEDFVLLFERYNVNFEDFEKMIEILNNEFKILVL